MEFKGASAYDQKDFLTSFMERRSRPDSPNNAIERPIIHQLLGDFKGRKVLDLGCGDASFGKELLDLGAQSYTGVEGSVEMMVSAKKKIEEENGTIIHETMESYQYPAAEFDIVTSRFAIHYVHDVRQLFLDVYNTLKEDGHFVFSVQHPLTTSSFASKQTKGKRGNWIVDDYFLEGERQEPWIGKVVVKYHRTIESYFAALTAAGFTVYALKEGNPEREHFTSEEEYLRRQRIPLVLAFSCRK